MRADGGVERRGKRSGLVNPQRNAIVEDLHAGDDTAVAGRVDPNLEWRACQLDRSLKGVGHRHRRPRPGGGGTDPHDRRNGRHTRTVDDEEHVVAGRSHRGRRRGAGDERGCCTGEAEWNVALLHVGRVGHRTQPDHADFADRAWISSRDSEGASEVNCARRGVDDRPSCQRAATVGAEQVGRREDLGVVFHVGSAGAADTSAGSEDPPVGQQKSRRVVLARPRCGSQRRPRTRRRVPALS